MKAYKLIDILRVIRDECTKFDYYSKKILDNVEITNSFGKKIPLSSSKKYEGFIYYKKKVKKDDEPFISLKIKRRKSPFNKVYEYTFEKTFDKDYIVPTYLLKKEDEKAPDISVDTEAFPIDEILSMDFFNLKGFAYSQRHERRDFALYLDRILYSAWIEGMFEDFNCALDYDVRNNNIHYKSTSKRRGFLLKDVLLEEIEEEILPDCWKEFLDKHKDDFIVKSSYDFKILEDKNFNGEYALIDQYDGNHTTPTLIKLR